MTAATQGQENWRDTILAGLANYIDAGSIVAGGAALALWETDYALSKDGVGIIGAIGPNAIGAGIGALAGGWLCDRLGRKTIYQWDMLLYAAGMALLVFAVAPWMIIAGFLIVGLAVGADIPASWSLIAEGAPDGQRARHSGMAQVLWYLGPVVVLLMSLALTGLGELQLRKPATLSGGQKQRVAVARALVGNPEVIFADEPTAALDRESGMTVVAMLKKLGAMRGTTTVMVTHDNRILEMADRIITLEDGRIVADR